MGLFKRKMESGRPTSKRGHQKGVFCLTLVGFDANFLIVFLFFDNIVVHPTKAYFVS